MWWWTTTTLDNSDQPDPLTCLWRRQSGAAGISRIILFLKIKVYRMAILAWQPSSVQRLIDMFNIDAIPVMYEQGLWNNGDLAPLAHMSLPLIGGDIHYRGSIISGGEYLELKGLTTYTLKAKEGSRWSMVPSFPWLIFKPPTCCRKSCSGQQYHYRHVDRVWLPAWPLPPFHPCRAAAQMVRWRQRLSSGISLAVVSTCNSLQ